MKRKLDFYAVLLDLINMIEYISDPDIPNVLMPSCTAYSGDNLF